MLAFDWLFHVLEITGDNLDVVSIAVALYRQDVITKLSRTELFKSTNSWTNQLLKALTYFC